MAITNRPEILALEARIRLAKNNVISEASAYKPQIYLEGKYQRSYPSFQDSLGDFFGSAPVSSSDGIFDGWDMNSSIGLFMQWSLYNGKSTQANVAKARALQYQQQNSLRQTELEIRYQLESSLLRLNDSSLLASTRLKNVDIAQESLRMAQAGFKQGVNTSLDVLSSELDVNQSRLLYLQSVHDYHISKLQLARTIGVLGEEPIPVDTDNLVTK